MLTAMAPRGAQPRGREQGPPLPGSGVFIFGGATIPADAEPDSAPSPTVVGGSIERITLTTGEIHADGGIVKGTPDRITGGAFIGAGVDAYEVVNKGPRHPVLGQVATENPDVDEFEFAAPASSVKLIMEDGAVVQQPPASA
jgi:hypothetical protein